MEKIFKAIDLAAKTHKNQFRKGSNTPYVAHPYAVGMILLKEGCSEDVVAAGILHDTIEDTIINLDYLRNKFGFKVADIVEECSEPDKSLPWEDRKIQTIESLKIATPIVKAVACADKLHDIFCMLEDYEVCGEKLWERFTRGREKQEWYHKGLVQSFLQPPIHEDFKKLFLTYAKAVSDLFDKK
ncbi:MAG: Bifunctional (p)ppGpp synthase/hydrolase RelA [Candidatus Dichloromethanomonas elyunquensis]|nr:MAG: Bifunctional (p)ppGpp synthase/hydrolase RelA [Candidatus Dichloromethanomonas elyunquensis]